MNEPWITRLSPDATALTGLARVSTDFLEFCEKPRHREKIDSLAVTLGDGWPDALPPLFVAKYGDHYLVLDGCHRGTSAILARLTYLPVLWIDGDAYDAFVEATDAPRLDVEAIVISQIPKLAGLAWSTSIAHTVAGLWTPSAIS